MLQSVATLASTAVGAVLVYLFVAAMLYAIIRLAQRKLRRAFLFIGGVMIAVAVCRIVYFVLVGPVLIAYLLSIHAPERESS